MRSIINHLRQILASVYRRIRGKRMGERPQRPESTNMPVLPAAGVTAANVLPTTPPISPGPTDPRVPEKSFSPSASPESESEIQFPPEAKTLSAGLGENTVSDANLADDARHKEITPPEDREPPPNEGSERPAGPHVAEGAPAPVSGSPSGEAVPAPIGSPIPEEAASTGGDEKLNEAPVSEPPALDLTPDREPERPVVVPADPSPGVSRPDDGEPVPSGKSPGRNFPRRDLDAASSKGEKNLREARQPSAPRVRRPPSFFEQPSQETFPGDLPAAYARWNIALAQKFLLEAAGAEVYLTITPRILESVHAAFSDVAITPEGAEAHFASAVAEMYSMLLPDEAPGLESLRRCGSDGVPLCVAFLAASVLAAYRMHTDEDAAANAYYTRFDELLGCGLCGGFPRNFDPEEYEGLWIYAAAWLGRDHGKRLVLPPSEGETRRYVGLALTHVPLRKVDIDRLPAFFSWAGYEAGERVLPARLQADLNRWMELRDTLTAPAVAATGDLRRAAVLAQIAHELECWDGSHTDLQGRRSAPVELFLQWERHVPALYYLARRPPAFPLSFNDGLHVLDAGADGWYELVPVDAIDGPGLHTGFEWRDPSAVPGASLRRGAASTIPLVPSEFSGLLSHHGLLRGARCAVLCTAELLDTARPYLEAITDTRCLPVDVPNLPSGWKLFTAVRPVRRVLPPDGLQSLDVLPDAQLIFQGGLRLGRRPAWLSGGPPLIIVAGHRAGEPSTIDSVPVSVDQDGRVDDHGLLSRAGMHVIEIGRVRRMIEIVEPRLSVDLASHGDAVQPMITPVALPAGEWALIGSRPGEFQSVRGRHWQAGIFAHCPFSPVWALSPDSTRGAVVLCLVSKPPVPVERLRIHTPGKIRAFRPWADAVYQTNIRRPSIGSTDISLPAPDVRTAWVAYCSVAREIKRRLRSTAA